MTAKNRILAREVKGAATECNFSMKLQKTASEMGEYSQFAQRLMGCFAHNFKKSTGKSVPIYLVLENCGKNDLSKWIADNRATATSAQLASVMRQIAEGLLYLSKQSPPVIHHDLKPANIVVKNHESGFPTVHLIDFGGMMYAEPHKQRQRGTVATMVFAPPEWFDGYAFKLPPSAFDMYAVGNTLADMAIGGTFSGLYFDERLEMPAFRDLDRLSRIESRSEFVTKFVTFSRKVKAAGLQSMASDASAYNFITEHWVKMIANEPSRRPTPEDILASAWLGGAVSPVNLDWRMWQRPTEPPVKTPVVIDSPGAQTKPGTQDDNNDGLDSDDEEEAQEDDAEESLESDT